MLLDFSQNGLGAVFEVTEDKAVLLKEFGYGNTADARAKARKTAPIVEVQIIGENPDSHHGYKHTATSGACTLEYVSHRVTETEIGNRISFLLTNGRISVTVNYQFYSGIAAVRTWAAVENISKDPVGLEYVSSFAFAGLDAGELTADEKMRVCIPHNAWVREVDWKQYRLSELGLDMISSTSTKRISVSNNGTWSSKEYLPMGAVLNTERESALLWQIEHNGSWQWELGDVPSKLLYLRLSGPTEQEHQWYKELMPGERFESVKVCLTAAKDLCGALAAMTAYRRILFRNNAANTAMPVIFNDYMNCLWADPTEEKELPLIDLAAAVGAEYYCMDAGWYADGKWWDNVGEWLPSARRFPNGIKRIFDHIRAKGMVPGIWLELEVMGIECPLAKTFEDDCFFMRHGKRVIDHGRYHLDFRNPRVRAFADAVIDRVVREYGVGYIKMDYNIDGGAGTETDADSFGDGLLEHNRAYLSWLDGIRERYPALIWENCGSGGMRMDYAMLERAHIQSVSDQTNYKKNAYIAAGAPTTVLPEQAAIWSYPLADADSDAAAFNMVNAMLQRIHLSGKIMSWSDEVRALVSEGIALYKTYRHLIPDAVPFYPLGLPGYHDDWLCLGLRSDDRSLLALWRMGGETDAVTVPLGGKAEILYPSKGDATVAAANDGIRVCLPRRYTALLISLD
ncbi:MAG: alpha-galactosidase [Clostridia bacterium]|nr:alpha-galactosidase [Clostridia bacterium]